MQLQYKREERQWREEQIASGVKWFTHVRPLAKRLTLPGAPITLRNGYTKDSFFGPECFCIYARSVGSIKELTPFEIVCQVPQLRNNTVGREWAEGGPLEVLLVGIV